MKKILVLEDKKSFFVEIEQLLEGFKLFPTSENITISDGSAEGYDNDYAFLKDEFFKFKSTKQKPTNEDIKARSKFFHKIMKEYSEEKVDFDYYIIDLQLKTNIEDDLGLDFLNFLERNSFNENAKTIILSHNTQPPSILSLDDDEFNKQQQEGVAKRVGN